MTEMNFCGASSSLVLIGTFALLQGFLGRKLGVQQMAKRACAVQTGWMSFSACPHKNQQNQSYTQEQCDISNGHLFVQKTSRTVLPTNLLDRPRTWPGLHSGDGVGGAFLFLISSFHEEGAVVTDSSDCGSSICGYLHSKRLKRFKKMIQELLSPITKALRQLQYTL